MNSIKHSVPGQYDVVLTKAKKKYTVSYGHHVKTYTTMQSAFEEYQSCIRHQTECAGLFDHWMDWELND